MAKRGERISTALNKSTDITDVTLLTSDRLRREAAERGCNMLLARMLETGQHWLCETRFNAAIEVLNDYAKGDENDCGDGELSHSREAAQDGAVPQE